MALEAEFGPRGRVTILEAALATLKPEVDEFLLAKRVTAGVAAALKTQRNEQRAEDQDAETQGLNRWQKSGIGAALILGAVQVFQVAVQLWPS